MRDGKGAEGRMIKTDDLCEGPSTLEEAAGHSVGTRTRSHRPVSIGRFRLIMSTHIHTVYPPLKRSLVTGVSGMCSEKKSATRSASSKVTMWMPV